MTLTADHVLVWAPTASQLGRPFEPLESPAHLAPCQPDHPSVVAVEQFLGRPFIARPICGQQGLVRLRVMHSQLSSLTRVSTLFDSRCFSNPSRSRKNVGFIFPRLNSRSAWSSKWGLFG